MRESTTTTRHRQKYFGNSRKQSLNAINIISHTHYLQSIFHHLKTNEPHTRKQNTVTRRRQTTFKLLFLYLSRRNPGDSRLFSTTDVFQPLSHSRHVSRHSLMFSDVFTGGNTSPRKTEHVTSINR